MPSGLRQRRARTSIGTILVNSSGRTLLHVREGPQRQEFLHRPVREFPAAADLDCEGAGSRRRKESLIGKTRRADGRMQVTYNHHPLYTFMKDTKKGQTNGEGFSAFGAKWYAVSPAGARVLKSTAGTGGGYGQ